MNITAFRKALASQLAEDLKLKAVAGYVQGPVESRDMICTYPVSIAEVDGAVADQILAVGVRVLKAWKNRSAVEQPRDPEPLEELAQLLQESVANHQTDLGAWFQRVVRIDFDVDYYAFDATVQAWSENTAL